MGNPVFTDANRRRAVTSVPLYDRASWCRDLADASRLLVDAGRRAPDAFPVRRPQPRFTEWTCEDDAPFSEQISLMVRNLLINLLKDGVQLSLHVEPPPDAQWKGAIDVVVEYGDDEFWLTNDALQLCASGPTIDRAVLAVWDELEVSVEDFVDVDPSTLSQSGLEYRALLEAHIKE